VLIICAQSCPHPHLDRATGLVALIALFRSVYCRVTVKLCTTIFLVFSLIFCIRSSVCTVIQKAVCGHLAVYF